MDKWEGIEKEIKMFSPNTIFGDYSATSKNESDITKQIVYLHMKDILKLLTKENLKTIPIKKIAWKTKYFSDDKKGKNCICCGGKRFEKCDIKFPSVVIDGMKKSLCYVLQWEKIKKYLKIKRIDDNGGYKICEVNSNPGFEGMEKFTKKNIAEDIVSFIKMKVGAGDE